MAFEQHVLNGDMIHHHLTKPSYTSNILDSITMEMRLKRIAKRQLDSASMFSRLQVIIDQIEENFKPPSIVEMSPKDQAFITDHNYAFSNTSSGVSSATSSPPSAVKEQQRFNRCLNLSAKRKIIDDDQEYNEFLAEDEHHHQQQNIKQEHLDPEQEQYPQQIGDLVILGPNGTQVDMRSYSSIIWSSAASATRQLLGFVFTSDILATHTLTGKPSPAFYGRERPAKMQLDPIKAADIIHCVRSQFNCTEREIRAAITTKCSDTSKKYKRRSQKQLESSQKM